MKKGVEKKLNQAGEGNWRSQPFMLARHCPGADAAFHRKKGGRFQMRRHLKANYFLYNPKAAEPRPSVYGVKFATFHSLTDPEYFFRRI